MHAKTDNDGGTCRPFSPGDIPAAAEIAYSCWHTELAGYSPRLQHWIYAYLAAYYFFPGNLAFAYGNGRLDSFLLGARKTDSNSANRQFDENLSAFTGKDRDTAIGYRQYLDANGAALKKLMNPDDAYIGLFASIRPGCGSIVRNAFEQQCRNSGIRRIFLWADETCNCNYYRKHGFTDIARFPSEFSAGGTRLQTIVFRKELR